MHAIAMCGAHPTPERGCRRRGGGGGGCRAQISPHALSPFLLVKLAEIGAQAGKPMFALRGRGEGGDKGWLGSMQYRQCSVPWFMRPAFVDWLFVSREPGARKAQFCEVRVPC